MSARNKFLCLCVVTLVVVYGFVCLQRNSEQSSKAVHESPTQPVVVCGHDEDAACADTVSVDIAAEGVAKNKSFKMGTDEVPILHEADNGANLGLYPFDICNQLHKALIAQDAAMIAECRKQLLMLGEAAVSDLQCLVNCGDAPVELEALRLLTQIDSKRAIVVALGRVLTVSDDDQFLPDYLAVFGNCRAPGIADWLVEFMGRTEQNNVRERVLAILDELRGSAVIASLARHLAEPLDEIHAEDCAVLLSQCDDTSHVDMLEDMLVNADSPYIRQTAANGLANVGSGKACEILIAGAASNGDGATDCLLSITQVNSSYAQETLIDAVYNRSLPEDTQSAVIVALANQRSTRVSTILENLADGETSEEIQEDINESLQVLADNTSGTDGSTPDTDGSNSDESWF